MCNMHVKWIDFSSDQEHKIIAPFGPFDSAFGFYGDGSFYLVDAPGHLSGHVVDCARIGKDSFVVLAADTCHNRQCYCPGHRLISEIAYEDHKTAKDTVGRLKKANQDNNTLVVLAHEREWWREMPEFPETLNAWALAKIGGGD
jgi:glyoxylase-like metal-dependent hydrolase (beta-lactamase superfamily II)